MEKPFKILLSKAKKILHGSNKNIRVYIGFIYGKEGNGIEKFNCKTQQNYTTTVRISEITL